MARNISGLRRGGPGRPKGSKDKRSLEMAEWAREFFASAEWRASAKKRMLEGKAPHLEGHILACEMPKPLPTPPRDAPGRIIMAWITDE